MRKNKKMCTKIDVEKVDPFFVGFFSVPDTDIRIFLELALSRCFLHEIFLTQYF